MGGKNGKGKNLTKEKPRGIIRVQARDSWEEGGGGGSRKYFSRHLWIIPARGRAPFDADRIFSKELIIGKVTPPRGGGVTSLEDGINSWFARKRLESSRPEVFYRVNQYRSNAKIELEPLLASRPGTFSIELRKRFWLDARMLFSPGCFVWPPLLLSMASSFTFFNKAWRTVENDWLDWIRKIFRNWINKNKNINEHSSCYLIFTFHHS